MASGGKPSHSAGEEKTLSLFCSLCLEVFTCPKLLPCHHTFCLKCLEDLTACLGTASFSCPQCRLDVVIPPGGVAAFQSNFYLHSDDLERARSGTLCLIHPKHDLDLYCTDCKQAVCLKCVLTKHKQHTTKDLGEAAAEARELLKRDDVRMQEAVSYMTAEVSAEEGELQAVQDKRAAVEAVINRKHATLVAMVNKARDESLASLNNINAQIERAVCRNLTCKRNNLNELCQLQQRLQGAVRSGPDCQLLAVTEEMREGRGSPQVLSKLTTPRKSFMVRAVLTSVVDDAVCMQSINNFYGRAVKSWMPVSKAEVAVKEQFRCGQEDDTEIFSILNVLNTLSVMFARRALQENVPCEVFDEGGEPMGPLKGCYLKTPMKSRGNNTVIELRPNVTEDDSLLLSITNASNEECRNGENLPPKEEDEVIFPAKSFWKFNVDSTMQVFAVVEEAQSPGGQRKVLLYRRDQHTPVSTYTPPTAACQPSDVCFYRLGGREVLLVADEGTDSVHVLDVQGDELKFDRYLAPGCPLLVQPTALSTDTQGRLWVACRGGAILTFTPIA